MVVLYVFLGDEQANLTTTDALYRESYIKMLWNQMLEGHKAKEMGYYLTSIVKSLRVGSERVDTMITEGLEEGCTSKSRRRVLIG